MVSHLPHNKLNVSLVLIGEILPFFLLSFELHDHVLHHRVHYPGIGSNKKLIRYLFSWFRLSRAFDWRVDVK